jgi:5-methylcytosine-specific restriction endonuclease McrA
VINIAKAPKPAVLNAKEEEWKNEYLALLDGDENIPKAARTRYRHVDVKSTLREESHDKCIFCESKISHTFPGETDHIIPVSKMPEKIVDWSNLGYVCKECNRKKSDYYDAALPLINPFIDEPSEYLHFLGPMVIAKTGNRRGQLTVELLELSRVALIERKIERIDKVKALLDRAAAFPEGEAKDFLLSQVREEAAPAKEYSATIKAYLLAAEV